MKRSILAVLMISAHAFRMADDAPAATNDAADGATATDGQTANADTPTVTVTVPAEHADLLQRAIALLEKGEQYVKDNIEAGVAMLEGLFTSTPAADAPTTDTAPPAA